MTPTKAQLEALRGLAAGATLSKVASDRRGTHLTLTFPDGSRLPVTRPTVHVLERQALITYTAGRGYHLTYEGLRASGRDPVPTGCPEHAQDNQGLCHTCGFPMEATFTLDGEPIDLMAWMRDNMGDLSVDIFEPCRLQPGGEITFGGGAAATSVLRRTG